MFRVKKIRVSNIFVNVAIKGEGKPIIFVHGWTNNWMGFIPLGFELAKNYKVVLVDLPGFGDSDRLEKYSLSIQVRYLKRVIEKLKLKDYIVAGHSMGTFVTAKFIRLFPKSAKKAVLIGAVFDGNGIRKAGRRVMGKFYKEVDSFSVLTRAVKRVVETRIYKYLASKYLNMYKYDPKIIEKYGTVGIKKLSAKAYVRMGIEVGRTKIEELIKNNQIPILLLFGKYDKHCNCEVAKRCLWGNGDYVFKEIDEAGHIVTVEKPKETARAIEEFVG